MEKFYVSDTEGPLIDGENEKAEEFANKIFKALEQIMFIIIFKTTFFQVGFFM